jgi:hypothetical protein
LEEWNKFTDSISQKFNDNKIIDKESDFPKYHFEYDALDIHFINDQGTDCWITYNPRNDREVKLSKMLNL